MSAGTSLGSADDRLRIHIWQHSMVTDFRFSFGPMGNRSQQHFKSIGAAIEGAAMHNGGFQKGAVIIIEPRL